MREQGQGQEPAGPGRGGPERSEAADDDHGGTTMGRPTEVSDAPAAPSTGGSWDLRSRALVSGPSAAGEPEPGPQRDAADPAGAAGPSGVPARAPEIARTASARRLSASRRGPADPVKSLMHRHRELCERAVDPLEVAAGLEAHGVTDRTAARYRHRDVFSLAEELFARVPGVAANPATGPEAPERDIATRAAWSLRALLPGAACLATVGALGLTEGTLDGRARLAVALAGALLAAAGLALALRSGPLHAEGRSSGAARVYGCWLLGYVLYGEPLLDQVLSGGPEGPWDITPAPLLGLALALAPATWCAHLFSVHAQRRLIGSRALEEFAAGVRPLLFGAIALHLCALAGLLYLAHLGYGGGGAFAGAAALGVLLLLARLLTVHGFPGLAAGGLAFACAAEALAPALVLAGRLPGLHFLARPVDLLVMTSGTGSVPAIACGGAALGLLVAATVVLSRASAHTTARPVDEGPVVA
ncbi:hypothetical protein OG887_27140 [Streptomyces sp. NBC_00053]|uniref:hypothetical protein n=1 Tax=unclassified Streptomyces TaxID=2593676 RepID=UPI00224D2F12|nr:MULTISPECIES: hypothetical protein [unclassified Streptomyces]MCX4394105.1 hypothetical protein [Streptomyces sp. NBC_01767]MCX5162802.1 hypothetical protein [Streptomyces sp. NBC_00305]MCX5221319.1 hypothetical protein [Streptomyces sp. NBC_00264]MCX5503017.1 hypothetical protein [Streptomyces sp. NBC_00052]MCX5548448.1 hypothetical protein [Streptomyces sp. NBC_00051]